ncbi:hypothetical protein ACSTIP_00415, partial [Vibrio parahaemolyticus]
MNQKLSTKVNVTPFQLLNFNVLPSTKLAGMPVLANVQLNAVPANPLNVPFASNNAAIMPNATIPFTTDIQLASFKS